MTDFSKIPAQSSLIDSALQEQLKGILGKLERDVLIKAVLEDNDKGIELGSFLKTVAGLCDRIQLELYGKEDNSSLIGEQRCEGLFPSFGLYVDGDTYTGISFAGIPGGKEINSFVLALYNVAGPGQPLEEAVKSRIMALGGKKHMQICVSLACHHCADVVTSCQRIASLHPDMSAQMIDARLYPELVKKYQIERVPVLIVNETHTFLGGKTMEEILTILETLENPT